MFFFRIRDSFKFKVRNSVHVCSIPPEGPVTLKCEVAAALEAIKKRKTVGSDKIATAGRPWRFVFSEFCYFAPTS